MRTRIIVARDGQTLVARGQEYIAPTRAAVTVGTSRQFDEPSAENRVENRGPASSQRALDRAWIYGNPRAVSPSELKRAKRLEAARALPQISVAEAISLIEAMKRADEYKARQAARERELAEIEAEEYKQEQREARQRASAHRLAALGGFTKKAV